MKILCVSATKIEMAPLIKKIKKLLNLLDHNGIYQFRDLEIKFLITGIGSVNTTYFLTRELTRQNYDLIINIGIAGSFNESTEIGSVVEVREETFADLGVFDERGFKTLFDSGFLEKNVFPLVDGRMINHKDDSFTDLFPRLKKVSGVTVNNPSGNIERAKIIQEKFSPDVETMEGAAFFFTCLMEKVPFAEIRAISNSVGTTDKSKWDIYSATQNLSTEIINLLDKISQV